MVGWGNLANTIKDSYHPGDRLIIEGRLGINMVERPEGFKEKRAEFTASRISRVDGDNSPSFSDFSSTSPGTFSSPSAPPTPPESFSSGGDEIPF